MIEQILKADIENHWKLFYYRNALKIITGRIYLNKYIKNFNSF